MYKDRVGVMYNLLTCTKMRYTNDLINFHDSLMII